MKNPFLFGKTVTATSFTNRTREIKRLRDNLSGQINTILISPRRWGKSSLVRKVAADITSTRTKVVTIDLMRIRNEEEFYKEFSREVVKASSNKVQEWVKIGTSFLKRMRPKITVATDPAHDIDIAFDWDALEKNYLEILNLPERIAKSRKLQIIVCIDEFQNLSHFKDPELFQKRLRTAWQHHEAVTYCLYGSRQHMMTELFERQSNAFYKFGDIIYLPKISRPDWIKYITTQFARTGKKISEALADRIAGLVDDHSFYVQQLSSLVWNNTENEVQSRHIKESTEDLLAQNSPLYTRDTEQLSGNQLNFLKAVASGITTGLSSKKIMDEYKLGTSANILKIKKALTAKELIDEQNGKVSFLDPVYELWFKEKIL